MPSGRIAFFRVAARTLQQMPPLGETALDQELPHPLHISWKEFFTIYRNTKKRRNSRLFIVLLFPRLYSLHCCQCGTSIYHGYNTIPAAECKYFLARIIVFTNSIIYHHIIPNVHFIHRFCNNLPVAEIRENLPALLFLQEEQYIPSCIVLFGSLTVSTPYSDILYLHAGERLQAHSPTYRTL